MEIIKKIESEPYASQLKDLFVDAVLGGLNNVDDKEGALDSLYAMFLDKFLNTKHSIICDLFIAKFCSRKVNPSGQDHLRAPLAIQSTSIQKKLLFSED